MKCVIPKKIPVDSETGALLSSPTYYESIGRCEWRDNGGPFRLELKFDGVINGVARWIDEDGTPYWMRVNYLEETFSKHNVYRGVLDGDWIVVKTGTGYRTDYGIRLHLRAVDDGLLASS